VNEGQYFAMKRQWRKEDEEMEKDFNQFAAFCMGCVFLLLACFFAVIWYFDLWEGYQP
jgi:cytochrome c oxidase assembly factor CtaG